MSRLPNTYTAPPGQWHYRVPETGQTFRGSNWEQLRTQLVSHYSASGYPLPDALFDKVEAYICANAPDYCVGDDGAPPRKFGLAHTFTNVLTASRTFLRWTWDGRKYVEPEVAERRAATCASCVYNTEPEGCTGCNTKELYRLVELIVGKRSTSRDTFLKSCRICSCLLRAKIHIPLEPLLKYMPADQQEQLPAHCWLKTEGKTT